MQPKQSAKEYNLALEDVKDPSVFRGRRRMGALQDADQLLALPPVPESDSEAEILVLSHVGSVQAALYNGNHSGADGDEQDATSDGDGIDFGDDSAMLGVRQDDGGEAEEGIAPVQVWLALTMRLYMCRWQMLGYHR